MRRMNSKELARTENHVRVKRSHNEALGVRATGRRDPRTELPLASTLFGAEGRLLMDPNSVLFFR